MPETVNLVPVRRALLSVCDKTGLAKLAKFLSEREVEIVSSGGTAAVLREAGIAVQEVSDVTGHPEILGGRVKTLHPSVHGGLLAKRGDPEQEKELLRLGIGLFDLVVVNFYPFTSANRSEDREALIELIDIGGPAMVRAAAKNHESVAVVTSPNQYADLTNEIEREGGTSFDFRRKRAAEAFALTASYDAAVSEWLAADAGIRVPRRQVVAMELDAKLRYGENPHQEAWRYFDMSRRSGEPVRQIQGDPVGYNNLSDAQAALELISEFAREEPACAIFKHGTPCGVAQAGAGEAAFRSALSCDPLSAFGGVISINCKLDEAVASAIAESFFEVIVAPEFSREAIEALGKKPRMRLLAAEIGDGKRKFEFRQVSGGFLVQERDRRILDASELTVATKRQPDSRELDDLLFAWKVAKHAKSNAIVFARDRIAVGIGAGQTSRVDAAEAAKAKWNANSGGGSSESRLAVASDGFFPFADGIEVVAQAGATAIIQPGGSKRDAEAIAAADARRLAMVLTGVRHFRH